jgi:hypothetical protein
VKWLALVALSACYTITEYPHQAAITREPYLDRVIVYVHWETMEQINKSCPDIGFIYACARLEIVGTEAVCHIHAVRPKDFNDVVPLQILGHEVFHCFGASHSKPTGR